MPTAKQRERSSLYAQTFPIGNVAITCNAPLHSLDAFNDHYRKKADNIRDGRQRDEAKALELNRNLRRSHGAPCVTGVAVAHCSGGHFFYKPVYCGREHCQSCGEDGSPAHNRRINRVKDIVLSWQAVSYLVVTVPEQAREAMKSKAALNNFRTYIRRKLKRDGFNTALFRWHWAGSCSTCKGRKAKRTNCISCNGTGAGSSFHPHLNILMPAGNTRRTTKGGKEKDGVTAYDKGKHTLRADYLQAFKEGIEAYFLREHNITAAANINHRFIAPGDKNKRAKIFHKLRYILRATLRDAALYESLIHVVKGYRNTVHLGQWKKAKEEKISACPCCGEALSWYADRAEVFYTPGKKLIEVQPGIFFVSWHEV